jgi:CCR4-NOT transcription complex subunit 1
LSAQLIPSVASSVVSATSSVVTAATASTPTPSLPTGPPEPRFNYLDINVTSLAGLQPHIVAPPIQLFQQQPQLKQYIKPAIERAIQEWIHPVVDRAIKIALTTCEQIVKKVRLFLLDIMLYCVGL